MSEMTYEAWTFLMAVAAVMVVAVIEFFKR